MAISYSIEKHATAGVSKLLATNGGAHIYNVTLTSAADNGNLIGRGDMISLDNYAEATAPAFEGKIVWQAANGNWYVEVTADTEALLVYNVPMIAEEYSHKFTDEANFFNAAGDVVRAHELKKGDIFEVSAAAFSGTPAKDKTISTITAKKMVVA
jgi:hypothetical protein